MLVRVLGGVELIASGGAAVSLPGGRQAALLAALVARRNEVVSTDRLIDLLWETRPPDNPEAALRSVVFKLRRTMRAVTGQGTIVTRDRGYQLLLRTEDLDADVFATLLRVAAGEPPHRASATLAQALELWRGPAYGTFAETEIARLESVRLEEARRTATERLAEALLGSGRADEVPPLLEPFVTEHPLREAARTTLMHALHSLGRTADALSQYHNYRRQLSEELGLEPSEAMRALQVELLQAPARGAPGPRATERPSLSPPHGLPGLRVRYLRTASGRVIAHGTTGTGPPLVALLGWVSSLDVVGSGRDPRSLLLERLAQEFSVTIYDRAGTGLSTGSQVREAGSTDAYGLAAGVEELEEVVRTVGPPVSLLAMCAAGPVAVALAGHRPEWVRSLALVGTFADGPATFTDKELRDVIVQLARTHWGLGSKMLADLHRPGASDDAAWHLSRVFRDSASSEVAAGYLEAMYDYDVTDLLPSVGAPALVLHYRGDRLIPFRGAQDLVAGLPLSTLVPLDGRVHLPDAADLDLVAKAITEHFQGHLQTHPHTGRRAQA